MKKYLILSLIVLMAAVVVTQADIQRAYQTYTRILMQVDHLTTPDTAGTAALVNELNRRGVQYNAAYKNLPVADLKGVPEHYRPVFALPWCIMELSKITNDALPLIKDIPVTHLILDQSKVLDLNSVKEMPLVELSIRATKISDLSPIKGMKIYALDIRESNVTDISPLEGMPLDLLDLTFTSVSNVTPVVNIPSLETLFLSFTKVRDLRPLKNATQLKRLYLPEEIDAGLDMIRKMTSLTHLAYGDSDFMPVEQFWKKYDAGELKATTYERWKKKAEQNTAELRR